MLVDSAAARFAVWPVLRAGRGRGLLGGAIVLFVFAIGGGTYVLLGRPELALRARAGRTRRISAASSRRWSQHLHKAPDDPRGWTMLGRLYLTIDDPQDAAKALARAIELSRASKTESAELYSAYGEAVVRLSAGAVPPEAEAAFASALQLDPKDQAARYFLGFAYAARGEQRESHRAVAESARGRAGEFVLARGAGRPHRGAPCVLRRHAGHRRDGRGTGLASQDATR